MRLFVSSMRLFVSSMRLFISLIRPFVSSIRPFISSTRRFVASMRPFIRANSSLRSAFVSCNCCCIAATWASNAPRRDIMLPKRVQVAMTVAMADATKTPYRANRWVTPMLSIGTASFSGICRLPAFADSGSDCNRSAAIPPPRPGPSKSRPGYARESCRLPAPAAATARRGCCPPATRSGCGAAAMRLWR